MKKSLLITLFLVFAMSLKAQEIDCGNYKIISFNAFGACVSYHGKSYANYDVKVVFDNDTLDYQIGLYLENDTHHLDGRNFKRNEAICKILDVYFEIWRYEKEH